LLIFTGFVMSLALLSYHSEDRSWASTGAGGRTKNWAGPIGAHIASGLYQALGLAGWLVPMVFFTMGWWQWRDMRAETTKAELVGIFLIIIAITGFLTLIPIDPSSFRLGGFIGYWLVRDSTIGLSRYIGSGGAFVMLILLITIGLLLATPFSVTALLTKLANQYPEMGIFRAALEWTKTRWQERHLEKDERNHMEKLRERATPSSARPVGIGGLVINYGDETASRPRKTPSRKGGMATAPLNEGSGVNSNGSNAGETIQAMAGASAARAGRKSTASLDTNELSNGTTARNRRPIEPAVDSDFVNDDVTDGEDLDASGPRTLRSVEDMVASASVKRPEEVEEKTPAKPSKIEEIKTRIARVLADYKLPSTEMLSPTAAKPEMAEAELLERARQLAEKCSEFNVSGQVKQISPGPVVTTFEFKPDPGVKYSRITSLVDDLCLGLKAESIRIDRIPGKSTVGIEVPNDRREIIRLREVIESKKFRDSESKLTLALGKTIDGSNYSADLAKMPHLLIAGATGAGKSVALNSILLSLLYKASPEEVKLILVDPKRLELGLYADLPHLLTPIVTDPKRAGYALKWAVSEMENRYKHLAAFGVRNIEQYNTEVCEQAKGRAAKVADDDKSEPPQPLPYIVVIIDELADLMMVAAREVEESITRLAQMARAVGIHLVLATQRPSVDVITGLIKANFPSRISFRVSSKVDSRTIIDTNGAEGLLGQGDMLFLGPGTSRLVRVHGAYVDEKEVKRICDFIRTQGNPAYNEKIVLNDKESEGSEMGELAKDEKYDDAVRIVIKSQKASTSLLQRHLRIGYGRAASIVDMMEREGIVGSEDGTKPRQVLVKPDFLERFDQMREEGSL
ncbi:MAG: DNA translocase FtsK 4TM domain-containing protein, partial [Acidobacteriota bacterium]|nr:DNA translocase FtsK 4TM domain-containing protein [Acidobacteriota bacterium]